MYSWLHIWFTREVPLPLPPRSLMCEGFMSVGDIISGDPGHIRLLVLARGSRSLGWGIGGILFPTPSYPSLCSLSSASWMALLFHTFLLPGYLLRLTGLSNYATVSKTSSSSFVWSSQCQGHSGEESDWQWSKHRRRTFPKPASPFKFD